MCKERQVIIVMIKMTLNVLLLADRVGSCQWQQVDNILITVTGKCLLTFVLTKQDLTNNSSSSMTRNNL